MPFLTISFSERGGVLELVEGEGDASKAVEVERQLTRLSTALDAGPITLRCDVEQDGIARVGRGAVMPGALRRWLDVLGCQILQYSRDQLVPLYAKFYSPHERHRPHSSPSRPASLP